MGDGLKVQKLGSWAKAVRGDPQLGVGRAPKISRGVGAGVKSPKLKPLPAEQGSLIKEKPVSRGAPRQRKI